MKQKLFAIHAGHFSCDAGALFGVIPKALWSRVYPADENNVVPLTMRCLLIDRGDRKILIEAGVGDHYTEKVRRNNGHRETDALPRSLAVYGYSPSDITDVFFTHLHWDHVNGAVVRRNGKLQLLFPNAVHWCSERQWDHSRVANPREKAAYFAEILAFIRENGKMQFIRESGDWLPGIRVELFDGHTPGQLIPSIEHEGKTYVYMSDLLPTTANISLLWIAAYDLYPVTTMAEKMIFLKKAAEENYILFFEHDYFTTCATVEWIDNSPKLKGKVDFPVG